MTTVDHYKPNLRDTLFQLFEVLAIQATTLGKPPFQSMDEDSARAALGGFLEVMLSTWAPAFAEGSRARRADAGRRRAVPRPPARRGPPGHRADVPRHRVRADGGRHQSMATLSTAYGNALAYARERTQGADLTRQTDKAAPRVEIGVHNHGPGTRYSTIDEMRAALDGRERRLGTIVDTGHYTRAGIDPVDAFHAFAGRVYGVHLEDVAAKNPAVPDAILGEGVLDLPAVFRALRDIGLPPDASLSIEYEANPTAPYDDVVTALASVDRATSRG